jgi:opacity protein-like surface antigen
MKKLLTSTTTASALMLAAVTPSVAANQTDSQIVSTPLTGVYGGVYGGWDASRADTGTQNFDLDGWDGGLFLGYKYDAKMHGSNNPGTNAAIEVFYGISNSDERIGAAILEKDDEFGVSFRPGLSFMDSMSEPLGINPYGILGYRRTQYSASSPLGTTDENFNGFDLGLGTQLVAYGDYGVRAEYTHTFYKEKAGIDPEADDIRVGLSYHF